MTNLFDAIKKLSEEELREQLALFEVFTPANVYKEAGHKVAKQLVKATNAVTVLMKKTPLQETKGFSIDEALQQHKLNRQDETREHLELALKMLLADRCEMSSDESEEALSVYIIDEAGEIYDLKEELLPAQKADWIAKYAKDEIKATDEEAKDTNNTYALLKLQVPLGKTKILRYLFVQLIASCVEACGGQMTTPDEDLPSWLGAQEKEELRRSHQKLLGQLKKDKEAYEEVMQRFFENNQCIATKEKLIEEEEHKQEAVKKCIDKLKSELQREVVEKEIHMKNTHINSYQAILEMSKEEIKRADFYIERCKTTNEELAKEVEKALKKKEDTSQQVKDEEEARHKLRETRWESHYSGFKFETNCLEGIRQTLNEDEIIDCERVLMELHHMRDMTAISWGEIDKSLYEQYKLTIKGESLQHFMFSFKNNEVGILSYEIVENMPYRLNIIQIAKLHEE